MPKFALYNISRSVNLSRIFTGSGRPSSRYGFAALMVISTLVLIGLGQVIFGSVPLMLFAGAIVTASKFAGIGGGIFSVILSTLACDFFFLPPIFAIDFDHTTWNLAAKYGAVAILSYAIFRQKRLRVTLLEKPALAAYGYLDGVRDGELFGWAIDPERAAEPAKVTAYMNNRPVAEALAVYYRPDVAEQFQCTGRHGFFFDLSQDCEVETEAVVDVRFPNGRIVDGAPLVAHLPRGERSSRPTLLFMHIPKTAGTTLRKSIAKNYKRSEVAYLYPDPPGFPLRDLRDLPLSQRAHFRLVVGHFQYGIHSELPNDCWYFTIMRDPVARVWSHYHFLMGVNDPVIVPNGKVKSFEEVIEGRVTANVDNLMVRCFAGVSERKFPPGSIDGEVYELAKHNLEHVFLYVGQQERLGEAYSYLQAKLGWNGSFPLETINRGSYASGEQMDDAKAELIRRFNSWDVKLYEEARKLFP